jgi:hypothetical protein
MQVIGFNFTKISGEKKPEYKRSSITTNIEFNDLKKENLSLLMKDQSAVKISFDYSLLYEDSQPQQNKDLKDNKNKKEKDIPQNPHAKLDFSGNLILSTSKEELKELETAWKKKQIPQAAQLSLYNIIMKKAAPKALQLQDELNIHSHIPLPQLKPKTNDQ